MLVLHLVIKCASFNSIGSRKFLVADLCTIAVTCWTIAEMTGIVGRRILYFHCPINSCIFFLFFIFLYRVLYQIHWLIFSDSMFVCIILFVFCLPCFYVCVHYINPAFRLQCLNRRILSCHIVFPVFWQTCSVIVARY